MQQNSQQPSYVRKANDRAPKGSWSHTDLSEEPSFHDRVTAQQEGVDVSVVVQRRVAWHREQNARVAMQRSDLPGRYRWWVSEKTDEPHDSFSTYKPQNTSQTRALEAVKAWTAALVAGERLEVPWLFLHGDVGLGKTHLAASALAEFIGRGGGAEGYFVKSAALMLALQSSFRGDGQGPEPIVSELCRVPLLVLDDFGAEKLTEFTAAGLFSVVDTRYESARPTIFTSNPDLAKWVSHVERDGSIAGRRIADRIIDLATVVKLEGDSWRMRTRGEKRPFVAPADDERPIVRERSRPVV